MIDGHPASERLQRLFGEPVGLVCNLLLGRDDLSVTDGVDSRCVVGVRTETDVVRPDGASGRKRNQLSISDFELPSWSQSLIVCW